MEIAFGNPMLFCLCTRYKDASGIALAILAAETLLEVVIARKSAATARIFIDIW